MMRAALQWTLSGDTTMPGPIWSVSDTSCTYVKRSKLICIRTITWGNVLLTYAPNEDSDQPAHPICIRTITWGNVPSDICDQRRLRSACASAQSDRSLRCPHEETLHTWVAKIRPVKILIRQTDLNCADWSIYLLGPPVRIYFLTFFFFFFFCGFYVLVCRQNIWHLDISHIVQ